MRLGIQCEKILLLLQRIYRKINNCSKGSVQSVSSPPSLPPVNPTVLLPHIETLARRLEGKLLLREEIPLTDMYFHQLLTQNYMLPVPAVQKYYLGFICTRCKNKEKSLFAMMPCSRCNRTHAYCRNCIEMGRCMTCEQLYYWTGPAYKWPQYDAPCTWLGELNYAQELGADRIKQIIKERKQLIIWAVTGAGKTEMLFPGINFALQEGLRICIASPRADVIRELLPRFQSAFRDVLVQALYGGSRDNDGTAQLILATTHQLYRYQHAFDVLVIDEVDAFPYHQDKSLQSAVNRAQKKHAAIIHLTATPRATQLQQVKSKKAALVFVPIRFHGQPLIMPKWTMVPQLQKQLHQHLLPKQVVTWLQTRENPLRQLLIFVPTIHLAVRLEHTVRQTLIQQQIIEQPRQVTNVHAEDSHREEKIMAFRKKDLNTLITTTILERGVTFPSVDVIVLDAGHRVFDDAALIQITGRAGRSPKDPTGEVVFFHDGLTDAMIQASQAIANMNKRRDKQILQGGEA